ncbi:dioxygenase [Curvibacter sp. CHRR-16]|nr:dioxygenase [Curvibacter sp. CHRR-16]
MDYPPPIGRHGFDLLRQHLSKLLATLPTRPDAIVLCSAHWEEPTFTVSTANQPGMLFDYYGFPPHTYQLNYPAPGHPTLAKQILQTLADADIPSLSNTSRGYDHGVFVPMLIVDPATDIPVVMVSIQNNMDVHEHYRLGQALATLREQNILVMGSGNIWHGPLMREELRAPSMAFNAWLAQAMAIPSSPERLEQLRQWHTAPYANMAHPHPDHLMPAIVIAGAGADDPGTMIFQDVIGGVCIASYRFG